MPATIIIGGQWGDEGKGKVTDALSEDASVVVRPNGSTNAGHTVVTDQGTFKFHLVPSGVLRPDCTSIIGAGVAVPPADLVDEIDMLHARGVSTDKLFLSDRAHVVMPYHPMLDQYEEARRGSHSLGTTLRGNGPAYVDKFGRRGIRVADLLDESALVEQLALNLPEKNTLLQHLYGTAALDEKKILEDFSAWGERLAPYVRQTEVMVQDSLDSGRRVLVETAQASLLDIDYGTYPYVTSSSPTAAGACQGAGIGPTQVDRVVAVFKAYTTRVGGGPFPTEDKGSAGNLMRERGNEFGTTTGRPRRTGWFDGVVARYSARLNGVTQIAVTKLDILDQFAEIPICTGYRLDGEVITSPPAEAAVFERVEPIYETLPGWQVETAGIDSISKLPANAQRYLSRVEELVGRPIIMVGLGPARRDLALR